MIQYTRLSKEQVNTRKYNVPDQWFTVVRGARRSKQPYLVNEMNSEDFLDFMGLAKKFLNVKKSENKKKVTWNKIRYLMVTRQEPDAFFYKIDLTSPAEKVLLFLKKRNVDKSILTPLTSRKPCGITKT